VDICLELQKLCITKEAGNIGVDNHIISIFDMLLKEQKNERDEYDNLYKNKFKK